MAPGLDRLVELERAERVHCHLPVWLHELGDRGDAIDALAALPLR